ncbi:aminotransferase class III-fold pyridoxal phosphate-dependent enzyme [Thalassobius vesicularis]|uniref:Aminotransferase class III-fold pyridoxal phosphate-dependent enzyme n=1 Tax=Thalassobius vesicularis TaxID=1294297 RepID=A0A4S3M7M6_9RHOB|nr:aminotransferase class III-fold pyridoxal phosphate-dependent enzyme [Thalassobius vesicularis]THD71982.1 aminotransferase class III-fold pyridoxal phosphate-dependent enzyme [Thalassobius vesicularis]
MTETLLEKRNRLLGPNLPTFYKDPVHLVRGQGVSLWDADGRRYLDCYNNVPHVGHCHPKVTEAICAQAGTLNTHTRYLHDGIVDYAERLMGKIDPSIDKVLFTCTGSEANDVALRMAQALTGNTGVIATDFTYHGNTAAVSQLGKKKPPIGGFQDHVAFVPAPDSYRPLGGEAGMAHARAFAAEVEAQIAELQARGHGLSALVVCPFFANEGFPDLPHGWLTPAVEAVRRAGGVVIADEVQPGFGRLGSHFWGHERIGFVPEIVTIGKPMANGHPVGAVLATRDAMAAFRNGFGYFNTFGGNPVSMAACLATLDVIEGEGLQQNAAEVGAYAKACLQDLAGRHDCIGDVRGAGLFFGAEMVLDRAEKTPAPEFTQRVAEAMRHQGVLLNYLGRHGNVLKMRPPMVFARGDVDQMIGALDTVLTEVQP